MDSKKGSEDLTTKDEDNKTPDEIDPNVNKNSSMENETKIITQFDKTLLEIDSNIDKKTDQEMDSKKENGQEIQELTKITENPASPEKIQELTKIDEVKNSRDIDENKDHQKSVEENDPKSNSSENDSAEIITLTDKNNEKSNGKTINDSQDVFSTLLEVSTTSFDEKQNEDSAKDKIQDSNEEDDEEEESNDTEIDNPTTHETPQKEGEDIAVASDLDSDSPRHVTDDAEKANDLLFPSSDSKSNSVEETPKEKDKDVDSALDENNTKNDNINSEKSGEHADDISVEDNSKSKKDVTLGSIIETFNIDKDESKVPDDNAKVTSEVETVAKQSNNKSSYDPLSTDNDIGNNKTVVVPEKKLNSTNVNNDETIVIDDDDDDDEQQPTIQKIRETLLNSPISSNVNKNSSTTTVVSSETDPLAFAEYAETETIIGDDDDQQVSHEIMSAFGNDPLNTLEEGKQTADDSTGGSEYLDTSHETAAANVDEDDDLIILDSSNTNDEDVNKENQNTTEEEMLIRQSSIALHPIFPELINHNNSEQIAENDDDPPSKRQRISLFSKSSPEPITPRIILRNNGNSPTVNKQLTMPLRRQGNGTLNPRQISLLVNQQNMANFLPNTPVQMMQLSTTPSPTSAYKTTRYHCDVCTQSFSDMNSLQLHVKKSHELRSETRTLVSSTVKAEQDVICHNCLRTPAGISYKMSMLDKIAW